MRFRKSFIFVWLTFLFIGPAFAKMPDAYKDRYEFFLEESYSSFRPHDVSENAKDHEDYLYYLVEKGLRNDALYRAYGDRYGASLQAARDVIDLVLLRVEANETKFEGDKDKLSETNRRLEKALQSALDRGGPQTLLVQEATRIYSRALDCRAGPLTSLLADHHDGLQLGVDELDYGACKSLWQQLINTFGPVDILALVGVRRLNLRPEVKLALMERAQRNVIGSPGVDGETKAAFSYLYLSQLYRAGLNELLLDEYEQLPGKIRFAMLAVKPETRNVESDGVRLEVDDRGSAMPFAIAAAYHDRGDDQAARSLLKKIGELNDRPEKSKDNSVEYEREENLFQLGDLLAYSIDPDGSDTFERMIGDGNTGWYWAAANAEPIWIKLSVRVASEDGYLDIARELSSDPFENRRFGGDYREAEFSDKHLTRRVEYFRQLIGQHDGELRAVLGKMLPTAQKRIVGPQSVAERLQETPALGYREHALERAPRDAQVSGKEKAPADEVSVVEKYHLPLPEYSIVRSEERNGEVVVIYSSQDLDSVGEVSSGGYWILHSTNGGLDWGGPYYTGLQLYAPYVVLPESDLSLFGDGMLKIEVERRELDKSSITFPPVGLRAKNIQKNLYITIKWQDLKRDSDGDGLTDFAEYKLLLDPGNPDSDGDSIDDGHDALPNVPFARSSERSPLMAAILKETLGFERAAIITGLGNGTGDLPGFLRQDDFVTLGNQNTLFVLGDKKDFSGLNPPSRMMVFSADEYNQMGDRMGILYPVSFSPLFVNKSGDKAVVQWSASWTGGKLILHKKGDKWIAETVSQWVT
ncbi:hypothetical protein [Microbulbifer sp.]|uniref:hypothetical protein n=1 Tax=Microbulbifer sp. TaxID=1908541 RepID=UPI003F29F790